MGDFCCANAFTKIAAYFIKILIYIYSKVFVFTKAVGGKETILGIVLKDGLSEALLDRANFALCPFSVINQSRMNIC